MTTIALFDAPNAAVCLACPVEPDCIYCLNEPPLELRRLCPIWLREHSREQVRLAAMKQRKQMEKFQAVMSL